MFCGQKENTVKKLEYFVTFFFSKFSCFQFRPTPILNPKQIGLNIRPYCNQFLEKMSLLYNIYVFTAASPHYAQTIINFLDLCQKLISGIMNRGNCMETKNGFFIKDLRILKDKNLNSMVMVDNLAHSFGF